MRDVHESARGLPPTVGEDGFMYHTESRRRECGQMVPSPCEPKKSGIGSSSDGFVSVHQRLNGYRHIVHLSDNPPSMFDK